VWWGRRGRPGLPPAAARAALASIASDPVTLLFLALAVALLGYELALGLVMPPNNWDSLTYHLARVAAWIHHGGVYWIPNAPTDRLNEFQPLAEQQILFLFVVTGTDRLYALPQLVAELAILLSVYGAARRLGYGVRPAACASFLLATFTLVALEGSTSQNDLVAASLPAVAMYFLVGAGQVEAVLGGAAAGIGLGVKLTTGIVWPALGLVALARGRRALLLASTGAVAGIVVLGGWTYVLNVVETGHLLGHGGGRVEHTASPSYPGSLLTALSILYMAMDISNLWPAPIVALTLAGLCAAAVVLFRGRGEAVRRLVGDATGIALPFLAPAVVILGGAVLADATRRLGTPVKGPGGVVSSESSFFGGLNNVSDESQSFFGPIGGVLLVGLPVAALARFARRRGDARLAALATALPTFFVVLALWSQFNLWLGRFLIVPVALTAPLFARLFRGRPQTAAYLLVGALVAGLAVTRDTTKGLTSSLGAPWHLSWVEAVESAGQPGAAKGLAALDRALPARACVGAVLSEEDPSYLLDGRDFTRRITYLPPGSPVAAAARAGLGYVVITDGEARTTAERRAPHLFAAHGWTMRLLGGYWWLARSPHATVSGCPDRATAVAQLWHGRESPSMRVTSVP